MNGFLNGKIEYRRFLGEDEGYAAKYAVYTLTDVLVREIFAVDEDMRKDAGVTVYFFPHRSKCTDENGTICTLPRPKYGDLCVLRAGCEDECITRIAEAGYFAGSAGAGHIRLRAK